MINKQLDKIELDDLTQLQNDSVLESKTIEYKEMLPTNSDSDRKEFLADISSFANTSGGDLIFGIKEIKGVPKSIDGVEISNVDEEIRKYENIIRDGLEPRINFSTQAIKVLDNKCALIFRVSKSWAGPHRVIYKGHDKFYSRNSVGKYPLDTNELKIAFNLSQTLTQQISNFKVDRIAQIVAGNLPVPFYDGGRIVLQIIPLDAFVPNNNIDLSLVEASKLPPIYSSGWSHRINLEGFLTYSSGRSNKSHSYTQLYRNGIIEAVEGLLLNAEKEDKYIPSQAYEKKLIESLKIYLDLIKELGINMPVVVFLSLIGVKGYRMYLGQGQWDDNYAIDRDTLQPTETMVESYDIEAKDILRPMFDMIWNACGLERSYNFDEKGNWIAIV